MKLKKQISIITLLFALTFLISFLITPSIQATSIYDKVNTGAQSTIKNAYGDKINTAINPETGDNPFIKPLIVVLNQLLNFIGVLFFLLLLYAGSLWMNAKGKEEEIEKAKKITKEAIIGLVIIIMARLITEFLLTQIGKTL